MGAKSEENMPKEERGVPEVSIIMPAYNIEAYIAKAIESVKHQTFQNWELIIVNDASTDSTYDIIKEIAEEDPRFKIINKEQNEGLSQARNDAIMMAKGKYIVFLDSDDWIDRDFLEKMWQLIKENDVEMVQCGFIIEKPRKKIEENKVEAEMILNSEEAMFELIDNKKVHSAVWGKMIKREFVEPNFPKGKNYEDMFITTLWISKMKKILLSEFSMYHYRKRRSSIIHNDVAKNKMDYLEACKYRSEYYTAHYPERFDEKKRNRYLYHHFVGVAKTIARLEASKEKREAAMRQINEFLNTLPLPEKGELRSKTLRRARAIRKNPRLFTAKLRLLNKLNLRKMFKDRDLYD